MSNIVSNDFEYSCSMKRASESVDFSIFKQGRPSLVIGLTNGSGDTYREIELTADEARQLREHLNDPETMGILGIKDIVGVRCPTCEEMVTSIINHPCKGEA